MLKISEIIPDKEDRDRIKAALEIFHGTLVSIKDKEKSDVKDKKA